MREESYSVSIAESPAEVPFGLDGSSAGFPPHGEFVSPDCVTDFTIERVFGRGTVPASGLTV